VDDLRAHWPAILAKFAVITCDVVSLDNDRTLLGRFDRVVLPAGSRLENTPMSGKYDPTIRLG
jgi:hypothetical protein